AGERTSMLDKIRTTLNDAIQSPRGDDVAAVRLPKLFARRLNRLLGSPLCTAENLEKRRAAVAKLATLKGAPQTAFAKTAAPVVVYFEKDRNQRLKIASKSSSNRAASPTNRSTSPATKPRWPSSPAKPSAKRTIFPSSTSPARRSAGTTSWSIGACRAGAKRRCSARHQTRQATNALRATGPKWDGDSYRGRVYLKGSPRF